VGFGVAMPHCLCLGVHPFFLLLSPQLTELSFGLMLSYDSSFFSVFMFYTDCKILFTPIAGGVLAGNQAPFCWATLLPVASLPAWYI
jgi:hypothetical protein